MYLFRYDSNRISITYRFELESLFGVQLLERHDDLASDGYSSSESSVINSANCGEQLPEADVEPISETVKLPLRKTTKSAMQITVSDGVPKTLLNNAQPQPNEVVFVDHVPRKLCLDIEEPEIDKREFFFFKLCI